MKPLNLFTLRREKVLLPLFALFSFSSLFAQHAYTVIDRDTGVMTFKYNADCPGRSLCICPDDIIYHWFEDSHTTPEWHPYECPYIKKVVFDPSFADFRPKSCFFWFDECRNLTSIEGFEYLNTSEVTNTENMFGSCLLLTELDLSHFDTSNVINMSGMFYQCQSLKELDISNFNTENVEYMSETFGGLNQLETIDLSNLNTKKVRSMSLMFRNSYNTKRYIFGKNFSTESLVDAEGMFAGNSGNVRYIDFFASDDTDAFTMLDKRDLIIPNTAIVYLPHGSDAITDMENVVYSYNGDENDLRCPSYYSNNFDYPENYDNESTRHSSDIEIPRSFRTNEAWYVRTRVNNIYGSVILPFEFKSNDIVQAYTLSDEHTETMYFKDAETVPAHTPFAFKKMDESKAYVQFITEDETGDFGITIEETRDTNGEEGPYVKGSGMDGWIAKGYYAIERINDYSDTYYIANNRFYRADGPLTIYPHRVTFHGTWQTEPSSGEGSKFFEIATISVRETTEGAGNTEEVASTDTSTATGELPSEVVTAIEAADLRKAACEAQAIYDAQGHRLNDLRKGLNIIRQKDGNVKKVIVR